MRVYLINPPAADGVKIVREGRCMQRQGAWTAVWAPITLALIASILEKQGWDAKISDCPVEGIDLLELEKRVRDFLPELVILNAVTPSFEYDLSICKTIKNVSPKTITVVIGIHPTALPEECLKKEPALDLVIRGEPEFTAKELASNMQRKQGAFPWAGIRGLSYRTDGGIFHEPDRENIENLDELGLPAWHLVDKKRYVLPFTGEEFLLIVTSRGCPHSCTFCSASTYYGKKTRLRTPKSVADELAWVKETFGISQFLFWSDSFTANQAFCTEVAGEIIRRNLKISWACNSRVDNVTKDLLLLFRKAGCWMIGYGIESGAQSILDAMSKKVTTEQIKRAVQDAHAAGIQVTGHTVLGYPGETVETLKQTISMTLSLPLDFVQYYCAVPFPGSQLYTLAKESGWLITDDWARYEQNYSVITTPQLSADEVMKFRKNAYRRFYFRPRIVWNILKLISGFKQLVYLFKAIKDFLSWF